MPDRPPAPDWDTVTDALGETLDHAPSEREAFLRSLPAPLRREVEGLIPYAERPAPRLEAVGDAVGDAVAEAILPPTPPIDAGDRIGPYRIVRKLGQGGHGTVFEAVQAESNHRVALKLLPPPEDEADADRLLGEVRRLAKLGSTHIVHYHNWDYADADTPVPGALYFVMEFVEGEPLTDFTQSRDLPLHDRAALLTQACDGVQYALRQTVLHRDIKPANVFCTESDDGNPTVKLLDFGLGKNLDADAAPSTLPYFLHGTPGYAAPEQHNGGLTSAATDVFGLGALATEVLTGHRLPEAPLGEPRPLPPQAEHLPGDLRAVLRKATAHEPADRYPDAGALGDDLRAFLHHRPVQARGGAFLYRARRFARRNLSAVLLSTLTVTFLTSATFYALSKASEARREAAVADESTRVLTSLFDGADPFAPIPFLPDTTRLQTFVGESVKRFLEAPPEDPTVRARLVCTLARVQTRLNALDSAERLFDDCIAQVERLGVKARWVAAALRDRVDYAAARGDLHGAMQFAHEASWWARGAHGAESLEAALALHALGQAHGRVTQLDSAELRLRQALQIYERGGADSLLHAHAMYDLGEILNESGEYEAAASVLHRSLAVRQHVLGSQHILTAMTLNELGEALSNAGDYEQAREVFLGAIPIYRGTLPPDHPESIRPYQNLSVVHGRMGNYGTALTMQDTVLAFAERTRGEDHPSTLAEVKNAAWLYGRVGRPEGAVALYRSGLDRSRRALGPDHALTIGFIVNLAYEHLSMEDPERAEPLLREGLAATERAYGANHWRIGVARVGLADALTRLGRYAEAEKEGRAAPQRASGDVRGTPSPSPDRAGQARQGTLASGSFRGRGDASAEKARQRGGARDGGACRDGAGLASRPLHRVGQRARSRPFPHVRRLTPHPSISAQQRRCARLPPCRSPRCLHGVARRAERVPPRSPFQPDRTGRRSVRRPCQGRSVRPLLLLHQGLQAPVPARGVLRPQPARDLRRARCQGVAPRRGLDRDRHGAPRHAQRIRPQALP